jgi:hypothetical protein
VTQPHHLPLALGQTRDRGQHLLVQDPVLGEAGGIGLGQPLPGQQPMQALAPAGAALVVEHRVAGDLEEPGRGAAQQGTVSRIGLEGADEDP